MKENKGFSLIEILVAVSIIGILTGLAVPKFNSYNRASQNSVISITLQNIKQSFKMCDMVQGFSNCNSTEKIKKNLRADQTESKNGTTSWCVSSDFKVGGNQVKVCVQFNNSSANKFKTTLSKRYCYKDQDGSGCTANTYNATCDTIVFEKGQCGDESNPNKYCTDRGQTGCMPTGITGVCASGECS